MGTDLPKDPPEDQPEDRPAAETEADTGDEVDIQALRKDIEDINISFFPSCFDASLREIIESPDTDKKTTLGEIYIRTVEEVLKNSILKECDIIQLYQNKDPRVMELEEKYLRAIQVYIDNMPALATPS